MKICFYSEVPLLLLSAAPQAALDCHGLIERGWVTHCVAHGCFFICRDGMYAARRQELARRFTGCNVFRREAGRRRRNG